MPPTKKDPAEDPGAAFTFTATDGTSHTLKPTLEVLTPGLVRRNRDMPSGQFNMMVFELLADEDALEAVDATSWAQNAQIMRDFDTHLQDTIKVAVGESGGSSSSSTSTRTQ